VLRDAVLDIGHAWPKAQPFGSFERCLEGFGKIAVGAANVDARIR
jgi:hypothetical protein